MCVCIGDVGWYDLLLRPAGLVPLVDSSISAICVHVCVCTCTFIRVCVCAHALAQYYVCVYVYVCVLLYDGPLNCEPGSSQMPQPLGPSSNWMELTSMLAAVHSR